MADEGSLSRRREPVMRVLVSGSRPESTRSAVDALRDAGHQVVRCHDDGEEPFPCAALRDQRGCPLDLDPVDVVLDVHDSGTSTPSAYEDGVACAARRLLPLVVASDGVHPYGRWATREIGLDADITLACDEAAEAVSVVHSAVAIAAARASLEHAGIDPADARAAVHRRDGRLQVRLTIPAHPQALESMITARVVSALRSYDRHTGGIDVTLV
jgi:hypothetical protein